MYESHWNLNQKPFENSHDSAFYYPGESHQSASLKIRYVIENRRGAALLSGPPGVGKSMLIRSLFQVLPESVAPRIHIVFPKLPGDQLLAYIADELLGRTPSDRVPTAQQSVHAIQNALQQNAEEGRHAVLAIDEAQFVQDPDTWDFLRLLLNFEAGASNLLTLLLVGQGTMMCEIERAPSLEERLAVKCVMRAFTEEETASYIGHRIQVAGGEHSLFSHDAMDAIHRLSGGIPRRINRLCELALLVGFAEHRDSIDAEQVESVAEELLTVAPE